MAFETVTLTWDGKEYTVPKDQVLRLIATIEDFVSLHDLVQKTEDRKPPLAKISMAYGAALRYAGARVTDDEVYQRLFTSKDEVSMASTITRMITGLLAMMIPPFEEEEGNALAVETKSQKKDRVSSKRHTKR